MDRQERRLKAIVKEQQKSGEDKTKAARGTRNEGASEKGAGA